MPSSHTLVLLPGLDGTDVFLRPLLRALPPQITPLVVQFPDYGANDYEHLIEIVRDAVRDLDAYWVLGWSFSGPLALRLAMDDRQRVRGVILCASFVRAPHPLLAWCRIAVVGPVYSVVRVARRMPSFLTRARRRETWNDKAETWARVSAGTLARRIRALLSVDARETLRRCDAAVVYLASSHDTVVPRRNAEEILRHRPTTQLIVLDGPHMALYTQPREAAEAICRVMQCDTIAVAST
jgi:pimeloyl-ACP methyl ester carboxylesterase